MSIRANILKAAEAALGPNTAKTFQGDRENDEEEGEFYKPRIQPHHQHDGKAWIPSTNPLPSNTLLTHSPINLTTLRLISWNIDVLIPDAQARMSAALCYLSTLISSSPAVPIIIFFQEMCGSDLRQIQDSPWIKERFILTDVGTEHWPDSRYGTTVLIDKRLKVREVWRRNWYSEFGRDGLFVDIDLLPVRGDGVNVAEGEVGKKVLRICNTHLESLVSDPPVRPRQLKVAAEYLRKDNVAVGLLAGDLNAIQPFDRTLHVENGLGDAYFEVGGVEDSDEGYTWGYQCPKELRERFGCSRMDKILFRGDVKVKEFQRVGVDVKVAEEDRAEMEKEGRLLWVTDHYGVMGDFVLEGWNFA